MKKSKKQNNGQSNGLHLVTLVSICFVVIIAATMVIIPIQNKLNNGNGIVLGHIADNEQEITFNDTNMYNAVKSAIDSAKIVSYNDNTKTIVMTDENIATITELNLGNTDGFYADEYNYNYVLSADKNIPDEEKIVDISGIEKFTNLTKLYLYNNKINDISKLQGLTNLQNLRLEGNDISNLESLSGLNKIRNLHLDYNPITNVDSLQNLTNLNIFSAFNCQITDISKLNKLTNMLVFKVGNNNISDISVVGNFTKLTQLSVAKYDTETYTGEITNIDVLRNLPNLNYLVLKGNSISDISPLENLTNLVFLEIDSNKVTDISKLGNLVNLTHLNIANNKISDISVLSNFTKLEWLSLNSNPIKDGDLTSLSGLTNLIELGLNSNGISNILPLKSLTNLTYINLNNNNLTDITALSSLVELNKLNLANNSITDITTLEKLKKIEWLSLSGNTIEDISTLSKLTKLSELGVGSNKVGNVDALKNLPLITLNLKSNKINDTVSSKTYNLPSIFKESQNPDSTIYNIYSTNDLILTNCTLSSDKQSIILKDGLKSGEKVIVKVPTGSSAAGTTLTLTPTDEYVKIPTPTIKYSKNASGKLIATVTFDKEDVTITNNGGKNTYVINSNAPFAFEYKDENGTTGSAKIDDISPKLALVSLNSITRNSFKLDIKGRDDESGISKIKVYVNDKLEKEYNYTSDFNKEKTEVFSIENLLSSTKYTYYIEVIDQVGNTTTTEKNEVITSELPVLDIKFTETPSNWTNSDVKLKVDLLSSLPSITAKLQYKIETLDGKVKSDYKEYTEDLTLDNNCIVKVRYVEGNNTSNEKIYEVKNIDKELPIIESVDEIEITDSSFKLNIKASDEISRLSKVRLYVDDKLVAEYNATDVNTTELTGKVTGLVADTKYTYYIEVEDIAGNITSTKSNAKDITTLTTNKDNNGEVNIYNNNNNDNNTVNTSDKIIYYVIIAVVLVVLVNIVIILIVKSKSKKKN